MRGYYSCHVAILSATWKFTPAHNFLTRFSKAILEVFWYSKWVMQHTIGNPQMSTFQRYKVFMNWSLDEKVMAPGSRGIEAVFSRFFGEDSGQTGEATGEPRVACCSWSCSLSYRPGLMDQLVVNRNEFAREGGCPGGKTHHIFSAFSLFFICVHAHG
jgi:hypothetical protein